MGAIYHVENVGLSDTLKCCTQNPSLRHLRKENAILIALMEGISHAAQQEKPRWM